jgi:hypothetical protein
MCLQLKPKYILHIAQILAAHPGNICGTFPYAPVCQWRANDSFDHFSCIGANRNIGQTWTAT